MTSEETLNASSRIMYLEAQKRGVTCTLFDDHETILMEKGSKSWFVRGSRTSLQSSVGKTIADLKPLTKKVLKHFGVPTAKGFTAKTLADLDQLRQLEFPIVIKPVSERHGKGVIVGIPNILAAQKHFQDAKQSVLFEEHLVGVEFRIVCVDFQFVAAAFRKPAYVIGDGKQTVAQLVAEKNKHPWRGNGHHNNLSLIVIDELVEAQLQSLGMSPHSIPAVGHEVVLRKTANLSTGGEAWDVTDQVCQENIELFQKIARACDLNTIGIDMMCESLSRPIHSQAKSGVIEVNASPGLRMHHFPLQGNPVNVAGTILDMVEKSI